MMASRYINILDDTPCSKMLALFIKAAIQTDASGELQKYSDMADAVIDNGLYKTAITSDELDNVFQQSVSAIKKQGLGTEANCNLVILLNEERIKYQLTNTKVEANDY